ncbi:MAG TPA: hypothetical protein DEA90_11940 [Opitutae bacterium]|nr:hypothetical protein [Puniceicoccaceae bacterium]HBR94864.1 hypothetical protein [Opitutae bacterium]
MIVSNMNPSHPPTGSVSDKTRQRILQAAGKIFAQGGYRAMTLREVTKEAGGFHDPSAQRVFRRALEAFHGRDSTHMPGALPRTNTIPLFSKHQHHDRHHRG